MESELGYVKVYSVYFVFKLLDKKNREGRKEEESRFEGP